MNGEIIYIINGTLFESGDEHTWVEEVFKDKEQAEASCIHLNMMYNNNIRFHISEHEISTFDYVVLLEERKEWIKELNKAEEEMYY